MLHALLAANPNLRSQAESLAEDLLLTVDCDAIAEDVAEALESIPFTDIGGRAGYQPGIGYVQPTEAASELLDEALQPFIDDIARLGKLGMNDAAVQHARGVLAGLYACRGPHPDGTVLAEAYDFADEAASSVLDTLRKTGTSLPEGTLERVAPEWAAQERG